MNQIKPAAQQLIVWRVTKRILMPPTNWCYIYHCESVNGPNKAFDMLRTTFIDYGMPAELIGEQLIGREFTIDYDKPWPLRITLTK